MEQAGAASRSPIGASLAIVGGALLVAGSFLAWARVSGGGMSGTATGIDGSDGWVTLVAGVVALVAGALLIRRASRVFAILALLAGLVGGGLGLYDALTAKDSVLDAASEQIAPSTGASTDQVRSLLDQAVDSGELGISLAFGIYAVVAGGALALVGGILPLSSSAARSGRAEGFVAQPVPSTATAFDPTEVASMPLTPIAPPPPPPADDLGP